MASTGKRIVLTSIGSLGDLHPYIAVALGLQERGHRPVVVAGESRRKKVEGVGLEFRPLRPDAGAITDFAERRRLMDARRGSMRVVRDLVLSAVEQTYEDVSGVLAEGVDLVVSHPLAYVTRLAAEKRAIPWASSQVSPMGFLSRSDPPALPGLPPLVNRLRRLGPVVWSPLGKVLERSSRPWSAPIHRLRAELGLPAGPRNPLIDAHSPVLALALFSRLLADVQPDWPPRTVVTGFPWHERDAGATLPADLAAFLDAGPPPIVFTLGDSAATLGDSFFRGSLEAARAVGRRAVLVVGKEDVVPPPTSGDSFAATYAPFASLFPRAAAVVHAGGIGTSGLAMRAGRPMLVVPFAHDQPDNADRLARLGVSRTLFPGRYTPKRAAAELRRLLDDPSYAARAAEVGEAVRREDGARVAGDAIEAMLDAVAEG